MGGTLAFVIIIRKNHRGMVGFKALNPDVRYSLRVFVKSYRALAMENIRGLDRPWANIINKAPLWLQLFLVITPAVAIPMWEIEE